MVFSGVDKAVFSMLSISFRSGKPYREAISVGLFVFCCCSVCDLSVFLVKNEAAMM